ncbi:MAG: HIT domain-containing protein [Clostridia bacterium]
MENCVFCKIIEGKIGSKKLYEDKDMIIINDIAPKAKYHYLMIPKDHYPLLENLDDEKGMKLLRCLRKIKELKTLLHLESGYRIVINQGEDAGQTVHHLHIHILAGQKLPWEDAK